ncbi:MAG: GGDEF domain-containing protein [Eubacteriales bacterium]|nr:GGDEF domain-containing protein [Eubacteriales bacterium]
MKQFSLLRYFKRWWVLIVVFCIAGGLLFYKYMSNQQTYVASMTLRYANDEAANGLTPSGDTVDASEIFSSYVVSTALKSIGSTESVDGVRSKGNVEEIIPDDVKTQKTALLSKGEEFTYYATDYAVTFESAASASRARNTLGAILESYFEYYGEVYVMPYQVASSVSALRGASMDYIEQVEQIDDFITKTLNYISVRMNYSSAYRSAATGYSFSDLYSLYEAIQTVDMSMLYAVVLGNNAATNVDTLMKKYQNRIDSNATQVENANTRLDDLLALLESYSEQNRSNMSYHWNSGADTADGTGTNTNGSYVLGSVYDYGSDKKLDDTTYDKLIAEYASLRDSIENIKLDSEYCQYIIGKISDTSTADAADVESYITKVLDELQALELSLTETVNEYNRYLAAANLTTLSSITVYETVNVKMYFILAFVLFFIVGCGAATLLGRGGDFVDYLVYCDHKTGLPNRASVDRFIDEKEKNPMERPFSCTVIRLDNLVFTTRTLGRESGDLMLQSFGKLLQAAAKGYGFIGYNSIGMFVGFFPKCSQARAETFEIMLTNLVATHNQENPNLPIQFTIACAESLAADTYSLRVLLRYTLGILPQPKED